MSIHEQIVENFNAYIAEHEKWEDKGVKPRPLELAKHWAKLVNYQSIDVLRFKKRKIQCNGFISISKF